MMFLVVPGHPSDPYILIGKLPDLIEAYHGIAEAAQRMERVGVENQQAMIQIKGFARDRVDTLSHPAPVASGDS
jgi:hypothetical protein